jgi:hypothetical protein
MQVTQQDAPHKDKPTMKLRFQPSLARDTNILAGRICEVLTTVAPLKCPGGLYNSRYLKSVQLISLHLFWTAGVRKVKFWSENIPIPCWQLLTIYYKVSFQIWSSGQSSWLQIRRLGFDSRHYQNEKKSSGSGTGSTQPRVYNWGATW